MNIKTFTARTMAEALKAVHESLGAHAVVLHTRKSKRGGVLGIGARAVVEITAADGREMGRKRRAEATQSPRAQRLAEHRAQRPSASAAAARRPAPQAPDPSPDQGPAGDLIRRTYAAARADLAGQSQASGSPSAPSAPPAAPASPGSPAGVNNPTQTSHPQTVRLAPPPPGQDQLAEEMKAVRQMVARMMHQQKRANPDAPTPAAATGDKLFEYYLALIEQEVAEELAEEIIEAVRGGIGTDQRADAEACREAVRAAIAGAMPVNVGPGAAGDTGGTGGSGGAGDWEAIGPDAQGRPRVIALVGPTGVGKTTTVAKLAATFKLKQDKNVALITMDTYRIAAVEQLRTYAGIIGVPLHVANTPAELTRTIEQCRGCDAVLIDTAGRSQRDQNRLGELAAMIAAADPHETHLVLSSTCSQRVLRETIEKFAPIPTDRVIFTKLDEAVSFGSLLNVVKQLNKRLSYITTGQEVPHQIEPGRADRLAALVMGEAGVRD